MQTITAHTTAEEGIGAELRRLGFEDGPPVHIAPAIVQADIRCYRCLRCASCGHRGCRVQALHRQREYRLLASCRSCGSEQEC